MLLKVDYEVLNKVIKLTKNRLINFINVLQIDGVYLVEYTTSDDVNNSDKIIEVYNYLEKFKDAWENDTLNNFYLFYSTLKDEIVVQFSKTTDDDTSSDKADLIQLLESNKHFIIDKIGYIEVPNGKKTVKIKTENVINILINKLKEN